MFDSSSGWNDLVSAGDQPCLAIDLPGFGRSSPPPRPRLSAYAEDIVHALSCAGVDPFTLVGHSLGGGVATAVAERMPRAVASLVLLAPVGFGPVGLAEFAALPLVRELVRGLAPHLLANPFVLRRVYTGFVTRGIGPTEELTSRIAKDAANGGAGLRAAVEAIAEAGRSPRAFHRRSVRYRGPVVAVWGDNDAIVSPAHHRGVAAALPQARTYIWNGMGHHPQRERPRDLAELVAAACEGREPEVLGASAADGSRQQPHVGPRPGRSSRRAPTLTPARSVAARAWASTTR